jgi:hypothetical protein
MPPGESSQSGFYYGLSANAGDIGLSNIPYAMMKQTMPANGYIILE